jgi:CspA family cold shock protein
MNALVPTVFSAVGPLRAGVPTSVVVQTGVVFSSGVVREFHPDEGWGVIDGSDVPGGCWVHFSAIVMDGFRPLAAGQEVSFRAETADQDGFGFRAVEVWTGGVEPVSRTAAGSAYHSRLTLAFDEPGQVGGP